MRRIPLEQRFDIETLRRMAQARDDGVPLKDLARRFGVNKGLVTHLIAKLKAGAA